MGKMVVLMAVVVVVAAATVGMAATSQVEIDRAGNYGSWSVAAVTDRMTDKKWYGAIAGGENGNYIQVDCVWQSPTKLNIGFYTKEFLGSGSRKIIYRVDAKPPHTVIGSYSDHASWPLCENECKENDKSGPGIILLNEMKGGSTLLLRLINYRGNDVNFSFQIDGAREAFEQVAAGCAKLAAEKKKPKARP